MKKSSFKLASFVIMGFMIVCLLSGCSLNKEAKPNLTGTNSNGGSNGTYTTSKLEKGITSSSAITDSGKLIAFVKNSNDVSVDMEIEVEFYDANGKIIKSGSESLFSVGGNTEIAVDIWDTPESFDNYKIYVDVEQTINKSYYDKVEMTHNNNGKEIAVQVKNNSNDMIDNMTVSVVFYQGDKVVGYDDGYASDVKPGRSGNFTLDFPYDKKYNDIKFDNYKVFVNGVYSYNW